MTNRAGVLSNSPLKYVLGSVRFAPWPLMAKKMDEIQNELREMLPLMHHIVMESVEGPVQPIGVTQEAWMLADVDKDYCAQITKDQVIFFTSSYRNYSEFSERNNRVLETLYKFMSFVDVNNIGIRYVDHVKPLAGECKSDYISEKFLSPVISDLTAKGGHIIAEYGTSSNKLRVNVLGIPGSLPIPQEMIALPAILNGPEKPFQIVPLGENELVVDMDSVVVFENPKRLNIEQLKASLNDLHIAANNFFRHNDVFTDHAFKIWKGES